MPGRDFDATDGGVPPKPTLWQRLRDAMVKPPAPDASGPSGKGQPGADDPTTVPEIEAAIKRADDKERLIGLLAAPIAVIIALSVTVAKIDNDPKSLLANGQINHAHVNPSVYTEVGLLAVGLAVLMLAFAWFRKRLYLGLVMALYGLSIFNFGFWGFGLPFLLAGAWYLVRAYRLQQKLKEAKAADPGSVARGSTPGPALPNKRYTPPTPAPGRPTKPKPGRGEPKAS
jgi:hypothetical protein